MLDFHTPADLAKAEQEGEVVYYGHDGEAGIGVLLDSFKKDFPKIKTSYVRLQTGALYAKITAERSAGRFGVDVLQLSDISPAIDFQKKGGWERHVSPELTAYKTEHQSNPAGHFTWGGVSFRRHRLQPQQGEGRGSAEDVEGHPQAVLQGRRHRQARHLGDAARAVVHPAQALRQRLLAGVRQAAAQGLDARAQLFDRLSKGDDRMCVLAEYAGYTLFEEKGADIEFVSPPDGCLDRVLHRHGQPRPHPEAAKLFVDWALSKRGQAVYQNQKILLYGSLRTDAGPMPTGKRLADFKLLFPTDWNDYVESHPVFVKEWNSIMGL